MHLIFLLLLPIFLGGWACPDECQCSSNTVSCTGKGLTRIPNGIPEHTQRLDLQENKISIIRKDDLSHLSQLKILQVMDNEIHTIEASSFDNLTHLERVRLNRNRLRDLPERLFLYNDKLHRLDLSENQLSIITNEHLRGPKAMRNLQLEKNALFCLETDVISAWEMLEVLTLNGNNLTTIPEFNVPDTLRVIRLADNPWLCDCRMSWVHQELNPQWQAAVKCYRPALLHGRLLTSLRDEELKCSGIEKRASFSCADTRICPVSCTCTESTVDCRDGGLTTIPANLPKSTQELRLEQNKISYVPARAFHNLPHLRRLDLSQNQIVEIAPQAFAGLEKLNSLVLYGNLLQDLHEDAFAGLFSLQLLLLNANQLTCLRKGTMNPLPNLNMLSLYDNKIRSISNGTFDSLKHLQTIHLAKNPLICDCNLEWLANLLSSREMETSGARCEAPRRLAKKRLAAIPPTRFRCKGSEMFVTAKAGECIIDHDCPDQCACSGTVVDCSNRGLTKLPDEIPQFTTELLLNGNLLNKLDDQSLKLPQLLKIDLSSNQFLAIPVKAFEKTPQLMQINLSNNQLKCLTEKAFTHLQKLESLALDGNNFSCGCHLMSFVEWSREKPALILEGATCKNGESVKKFVDLDVESSSCEGTRDICADDGNYCPPGCLCKETIVRCSSQNHTAIPTGVPMDTTELLLDSNSITKIEQKELIGLQNLIKLDLSNNRITSIENDTFASLPKLSTLILSYNKIQCLAERAFTGMTNLRILSLHGNDISTLQQTAFDGMANITHIALGSNSLYCDSHQSQLTCGEPIPPKFLAKCDPCAQNKCENKGTCQRTGNAEFTCICAAGHYGARCEKEIDACFGHPCLNNATCKVTERGRFNCVCRKGFTGQFCQINKDDCVENKCQNEGKCIDMVNGYRCECEEQFAGKYCEEKLEFCSKRLNPCKNGGICSKTNDTYSCDCAFGFTGKNCEINIDDCKENECRNGAQCVDGVGAYTCECTHGFRGPYCELPPSSNFLYQSTHHCSALSCIHGACMANEEDDEHEAYCQCHAGYLGSKCDVLVSAGFSSPLSFLALEPLNAPSTNISFVLTTESSNGIIAYHGDESAHISIELFSGRIKVSWDVGNPPASLLYSYSIVNDNRPHAINLVLRGQKLAMKIDGNDGQFIENSGSVQEFALKKKDFLYFGRPQIDTANQAIRNFHVRQNISFKGCLSDLIIDKRTVDFSTTEKSENIEQGCSKVINYCAGNVCGKGKCTVDLTTQRGYKCQCPQGFSGNDCSQRKIQCNKEKFKEYHVEGDCRSIDEIKSARCDGYCGENGDCCTAVKQKRRKVKLHCKNGTSKVSVVPIVRKCLCNSTCSKRRL
ncbi:unnamed protein product, partial [Mesorhabditis belari]|uniref:Uncharacterized protein n=1 Tax=Mesorhabditis belari TaxID=2138241 RepID=A0AAF3EGT5_9BILA